MTTVAQVSIASDAIELGEILTPTAPIEIELPPFVPLDTHLVPYIWVRTDDVNAFEATVRGDPRVASLTRHEERADGTLYRVEWAVDLDGFLELVTDHDVLIERGYGTADEWSFQLRVSDHRSLRTFYTQCRNRNVPLRVEWSSDESISSDSDDDPATERGRDADPERPWRDHPRNTADRDRDQPGATHSQPFRQIVENLDEVVWMTDPDKEELLYVNPAYEDVWVRPRQELYDDPLSFLDAIHADDRERVRAALEAQPSSGYDEEYRLKLPDGEIRWIHDRAVTIRNADGDVYRVAGIAEDITERKKRERILTGLTEATRELFDANTREAVGELAVRTASERLHLSLVSLYFFDESAGALRPVAYTPDVTETVGDLPTFTGSGSLAWNAFVTGETQVYDDVRRQALTYNRETPIRSELIVPLADYGILLVGDTKPGAFEETDVEFAELLAITTVEALDNVEYERHLERQNERLVELARLNSVIRSINRAIVDATTRDEIATKVCENIATEDAYHAAWIGEYRTDREVTIHATAGLEGTPVESEAGGRIPVGEATLMDELVGTASATRAVHVMQDIREDANVDEWHEQLLDSGCRGAVSVPLTAGEALYGILTLYTEQSDAFDEEEVAILRELGQTIGRAIRAAEARRALVTEAATELEFDIRDTNSCFVAISDDLECRLSLEGVVPLEGERLLCYVTANDVSPDALRDRAAQMGPIETCRMITETDDGGVFEFRVAGRSAVLTLFDYSATIRSAVAARGTARVTAEIASEMDSRTVLNGLQETCPTATLIGKRDLDRPVKTVQQFRQRLTERLTDKQLNALRSAYFSGYFEWPRASTAEDIAEPMGIASSTFHFHLRHALEKLLSTYFETQ